MMSQWDQTFSNILGYKIRDSRGINWSAQSIVDFLESKGIPVYLAGGAVRDIITGNNAPKDIDMVARAPIVKTADILKEAMGTDSLLIYNEPLGSLRVGNSHSEYIDVGMFRDINSIIGASRLSEIHWGYSGDPYADALTTDFTINAMYWRMNEGVLDPLNRGIADCQARKLVIAADPRKAELDLRLTLRMALFACRGFVPDNYSHTFFVNRINDDVASFGVDLAGYLNELTRDSSDLKAAILHFCANNGASAETIQALEFAVNSGSVGYTSYWNNSGNSNSSITVGNKT
ncbi:CCA tRNA nucleotidyltransferase [Sphingomonas sanguinis]|uniref:CCA tRNA nucleotidyltransferase n=1 Tax=Sphingomonas sanguinis TaxID=33051 RepID=UPI0009E9B1BC|nr:CCA tRNA nucleotidyltransferase [Sphingomonas sanguinis]